MPKTIIDESGRSQEKAIYSLYAMSFLSSVGFGAFGIVVCLYMWGLGISFSGLGLALGAFGISMGIAGMFFGARSDIVGRKRYLVLSLVLDSVVMFLYTQAHILTHFVVLEILSGVSVALNGIIVPALVTDLTEDAARGGKFGKMGGFGWLGTGLGYFVGGLLVSLLGFFWVFVSISILDAIACLLILTFIPPCSITTRESFSLSLLKGLTPQAKTWLIASFVGSLSVGPIEAMVIPIYLVGSLGVDAAIFGTFMAAGYAVLSLTQFLGGGMADRYERKTIFTVSHIFSAIFIALQPSIQSFSYFAVLYILEGFGEGLSAPSNNALRASSVRPEHRGLDFSLLSLAGNIGHFIGSIGIGLLLDIAGFAYPFYIRALTYVSIAAFVYLRLK